MTPGRDAFLRCEGSLPGVTFELLKDGEEEALTSLHTDGASADLVLLYVGPQHAGNYSCRYRSSGELSFVSELSDPVELLVAGELGSSLRPLLRLCLRWVGSPSRSPS